MKQNAQDHLSFGIEAEQGFIKAFGKHVIILAGEDAETVMIFRDGEPSTEAAATNFIEDNRRMLETLFPDAKGDFGIDTIHADYMGYIPPQIVAIRAPGMEDPIAITFTDDRHLKLAAEAVKSLALKEAFASPFIDEEPAMNQTKQKYELIEDDRIWEGSKIVAYRIRAMRDIPEHGVKSGDLGGYVGSLDNLSHKGAAWVAGRAQARDNGRVEGDAIAKDYASVRDNAVLTGNATLTGHARLQDFAILRENAVVGNSAVVEGHMVLGGNIKLMQAHVIDGNHEITEQDELPWSLSRAQLTDPEFLPRMQEAVQIDPAFGRIMDALGATDPQSRHELVDAMFNGNSASRDALMTFAWEVGGTFTPDNYQPVSDLDAMRNKAAMDNLLLPKDMTRYRLLHWVSENTVDTPESKFNAAVVRAVIPDEETGRNREYYQAALVQSVTPEMPTLSPMQMKVMIGKEAYNNPGKAMNAANTHAKEINGRGMIGRFLDTTILDAPEPVDLQYLPLLSNVRELRMDFNKPGASLAVEPTRVMLQKFGPSQMAGAQRQGMSEAVGYAAVDLFKSPGDSLDTKPYDLMDIKAGSTFHKSQIEAHRNVETIFDSKERLLKFMQAEIAQTGAAIKEVETALQTEANPMKAHRLQSRLNALDPINTNIVAKVAVVETPAPRLSSAPAANSGITFQQIKDSITPLEWRYARDPLSPNGFSEQTFEATTKSLNADYTVEFQHEGNWSFYVESPDDKNVPMIERQDNFATAELAMEGVEDYRARAIAEELGVSPSASLQQDILNTPAGERALKFEIDSLKKQGYDSAYICGHSFDIEDAARARVARQAPDELAVAFRHRTENGVSFYPGSMNVREDGRMALFSHGDSHPTAEAALSVAVERIQQQAQQTTGPVIDAPVVRAASGMAP